MILFELVLLPPPLGTGEGEKGVGKKGVGKKTGKPLWLLLLLLCCCATPLTFGGIIY